MAAREQGFTYTEMVIVVALILVIGAIAAPVLMNSVNSMTMRAAAGNFSGLLQQARMQSVRKNSFYPVLATTLAGNDNAYFIDLNKNGSLDAGEPVIALGQTSVFFGTGSGAPQESQFLNNFAFSQNPNTTTPAFNARGIPCTYSSSSNLCPEPAYRGDFFFLSNPAGNWASVVITPGGRLQVWMYDSASGNWVQQ